MRVEPLLIARVYVLYREREREICVDCGVVVQSQCFRRNCELPGGPPRIVRNDEEKRNFWVIAANESSRPKPSPILKPANKFL